ncbi:MAG: hydroxysqualene dehydroxylase HpnE [Pseudomonadota bacterium]|nr:hydroxysqualene dehydroxylase HpnE [Pseudomonadota bacterium]
MTTLIVGGGWSGLAAGVRLSQQGHKVHLFESARQLGGRARSVDWQGLAVDNGQHLMIGAYRQTLSLLNDIGADNARLFHRLPLNIDIHDPDYPSLRIAAGFGLPWPLSLAWRLWRDNDGSCLAQISRINLLARRFQAAQDISVASWLTQAGQSHRLVRQLWEPLCLATLNTPIKEASAAVFARVLSTTFRARSDTDLLIPRLPLGETLPRLAEHYIRQHGGQIHLQSRVENIEIEAGRVTGLVTQTGARFDADNIIVATPLAASRALLSNHLSLPDCDSFPIATVYLQYPSSYRLPAPVTGMSGSLSQWLFDRHELRPGLLAVVISGPGEHEKMTKDALLAQVAREIRQQWPQFPAMPEDGLVIREKKATFACNVDIQRQRPNNRTEITGLWLAGDFVANPYPATLEGAVLNGEQTAMELMDHVNASR